MKTTVNLNDFRRAFVEYGRAENFTYEGLAALFEWIEEYEDATGEEMEFDIVALCCDFTEYADLEEFQRTYNKEYESIEDIECDTIIIPVGDESFIIQNF